MKILGIFLWNMSNNVRIIVYYVGEDYSSIAYRKGELSPTMGIQHKYC